MGGPLGALRARESAEGLLVDVQVQPRSSRSGIVGVVGDRLKVALTAPPVEGAANAALIDTLASAFSVPRAAVRILRGQTGRKKTIAVAGRRLSDLEALLPRA